MSRELFLANAKKKLLSLIEKIKFHDELYYSFDDSQISDNEYDQIKKKAAEIVNEFPELHKLFDEFERVGFDPSEKFQKIKHEKPMLSLGNAFSKNDIEDFFAKIERFFPNDRGLEFNLELKIDGLSFSAIYENGVYIKGLSRGNGIFGENITENIGQILDFPAKINRKINFEIRGEAYMPLSTFKELSDLDNATQIMSTPRNIASGTLRALDKNTVKSRRLKYFVYSLNMHGLNKQSESLKFAKNLGFSVNEYSVIAHSINEVEDFYIKILKIKDKLDYGIDGIVLKINDLSFQERMGSTNKAPRWAIAYKFPSQKKETQIIDIITQVGRTGVVVPVAILDTVEIGGCKISKATLHNFFELERKDIRINDFVILERAGDVIPHIISSVKEKRPENTTKYEIPTICPCCGTNLIVVDKLLKCPSIFTCEEQKIKRIEFFVSKDAFDIVGLSKKTIRKFLDAKIITSISSIFDIETKFGIEKISNLDGMGKKSAQNLFREIEKSKKSSLSKLIRSLGIEHIGDGASKLIAKNIKNPIDIIDKNQIKILESIDGIGNKIIESFFNFISIKENKEEIQCLLDKIVIEEDAQDPISSYISSKKIVFTGSLEYMSRQEAKKIAERHGAIVSNAVTKNTDLVVLGKNSGSKFDDAKKFGIEILDEAKWLSLVKNNTIL